MDREDVKRLPVVDEVVRVYLSEDAGSIDVAVDDGVVTLSGKVERWSPTGLAVRLTKQVAGVVEVVDMLTFAYDDRALSGSGTRFGVI